MHAFSAIAKKTNARYLFTQASRGLALPLCALHLASACVAQTRTDVSPAPIERLQPNQPASATAAPPSAAPVALPSTPVVVLLLPTEHALLRRAAQTVRDGARAVSAKAGKPIELRDCPYAADGVQAAYRRCVTAEVTAVIGPLGRSEVAQLLASPLEVTRTTLMLSPSGVAPPEPFYVLAPDLESEAERIARQSLEDACLKPIVVDGGGPLAARVVVAVTTAFRATGAATPLRQAELGARARWTSLADQWRRDGIDCVLFAGNGAQLSDFRPFLRNIVVYATSASFESELDRTIDWTGVRITDSPFVLNPTRSDYAAFAPIEPLSPTLARLYALGVDAARIVFEAVLNERGRTNTAAEPSPEGALPPLDLPAALDGAIGRLNLQSRQYVRTPAVGEFRGRRPELLGN